MQPVGQRMLNAARGSEDAECSLWPGGSGIVWTQSQNDGLSGTFAFCPHLQDGPCSGLGGEAVQTGRYTLLLEGAASSRQTNAN